MAAEQHLDQNLQCKEAGEEHLQTHPDLSFTAIPLLRFSGTKRKGLQQNPFWPWQAKAATVCSGQISSVEMPEGQAYRPLTWILRENMFLKGPSVRFHVSTPGKLQKIAVYVSWLWTNSPQTARKPIASHKSRTFLAPT